ncbi:hypothetical protein [Geminicoccus harenae]|uniref:hypothetical protein n=1 Tax=Geminicoccus harenae TaxID=2498453 RepID=UPI00168B986B|nr:hypothetical protein [Geminicoccus harenae]
MTGALVDMASVIVAYFAWLKEWQTLAGAIFGFSGIILTLWYNSGQERRRYRTGRQCYLSAIRAELENYQDELASMVRLRKPSAHLIEAGLKAGSKGEPPTAEEAPARTATSP